MLPVVKGLVAPAPARHAAGHARGARTLNTTTAGARRRALCVHAAASRHVGACVCVCVVVVVVVVGKSVARFSTHGHKGCGAANAHASTPMQQRARRPENLLLTAKVSSTARPMTATHAARHHAFFLRNPEVAHVAYRQPQPTHRKADAAAHP